MAILDRIIKRKNDRRFRERRARNIYLILLFSLIATLAMVMVYNLFIYDDDFSPIVNGVVNLKSTNFEEKESLDLKGSWNELDSNRFAIAITDVDKEPGYVFTIPGLYCDYTITANGDIVSQNSIEKGSFFKPYFARTNIYLVVELASDYTINEEYYPQLLTYDKYLRNQQHSNIMYAMFMGCIVCFITIYLLMDVKNRHKIYYIKECILLLIASCLNFFSSALPYITTNEALRSFFLSKYMYIVVPILSALSLSVLIYYCMRIFFSLSPQLSFLGLAAVFILYVVETILNILFDSPRIIQVIDSFTVATIMIIAVVSGLIAIARKKQQAFWLGIAMLFLILGEISIHIEIKGHPIYTSLYVYPVCICIYWIIVTLYMRQMQQESEAELFAEKVANFKTNQEKNQLLLNQIKPHFIYNCLSNIKYLYKHDVELADKAMVSFTNYLRHNIDHLGVNTPIPFKREMNNIQNYLSLAVIRYNNAFKVVYNIEFEDFNIYPFTLQPLIENAVKHGVSHMKGSGIINFSVSRKEDNIIISIKDNGKGFDSSIFDSSSSDEVKHVGLMNTINRIQLYLNGSITIESAPEDGTLITITFPIIE